MEKKRKRRHYTEMLVRGRLGKNAIYYPYKAAPPIKKDPPKKKFVPKTVLRKAKENE